MSFWTYFLYFLIFALFFTAIILLVNFTPIIDLLLTIESWIYYGYRSVKLQILESSALGSLAFYMLPILIFFSTPVSVWVAHYIFCGLILLLVIALIYFFL